MLFIQVTQVTTGDGSRHGCEKPALLSFRCRDCKVNDGSSEGRERKMKVSEMMHENPVCCTESDTAQRAAELMKQAHAGALPVVARKSHGKVIGIVTDRDLCLRVVLEARDPLKVRVGECMTSLPVCCSPGDEVETALSLMMVNHVRRIPVVDAEQRICGMISFANLVTNHVDPSLMFDMLRAVSVPTPEAMAVRK